MYQKNPLLEFSPADLLTSARAAKPALQQLGLSAKRVVKGGKAALKSKKPLDAVAKMVTHNAAKDKTILGKTLRAGNAGLDATKMGLVAYTPPMPSPDARSLRGVVQSIKNGSGKDAGHTARLATATRLGRTIKHPIKTTKRFLDRTVTGAVTDMPMLTMPGYAGPNPFFGVANGTSAKDVYRYGRDAIGYNLDRLKHLFVR